MEMQTTKVVNATERDLAMSAPIKELVREQRRLIAMGCESEALTNEQIKEQVKREMEAEAAKSEASPAIDLNNHK